MNVLTASGALLGLVAHVLVAAAVATSYWLVFRDAVTGSNVVQPALNPQLNDTGFREIVVRYNASHLGIWTACFRELDYGGSVSCGFIDAGCRANICWVRNGTAKSCTKHKVAALVPRCAAFQATRALSVAGLFFSILGTTLLFVSLCAMARLFAASGAACALLATVCLVIAFALFFGLIVNMDGMHFVARRGYSISLLITAWVVAFAAGLAACLGALGAHKDDDDD